MNSSTSSFKTECKVILFVLLSLVLVELYARHLSRGMWDPRQLRALPEQTAQLQGAQPKGVLFLGNSLFRDGLDPEILESTLEKPGRPVLRLAASGTTITDWYYYFRTYFSRKERVPELVVVGFARRHLDDQNRLVPGRLGAYSCEMCDTPEVFSEDITDFGGRVEFFQGMALVSVAHRDWLRHRYLMRVADNYPETQQRVHDDLQLRTQKAVPEAPTYTRLRRFIQTVRESRARLVFVAMPTKHPYAINSEILIAAREAGVPILDCREVPGISRADFKDNVHLTPDGARVFSRYLAKRLEPDAARLAEGR
ncbi:MAG TPA: hypothetical protein VEK08_06785 [Planctomycetota bacterium]|nr:hypothetical protein [Planctomycetota bacterium]